MNYNGELSEGINNESEYEYNGIQEIKEKVIEELEYRDLEKLREYEKQNPKKVELTKEDKILIDEQNKTGKTIDRLYKRELFLRANKEKMPISDYTKILYRLPLTEKQMKELYHKILDDQNNILN